MNFFLESVGSQALLYGSVYQIPSPYQHDVELIYYFQGPTTIDDIRKDRLFMFDR